MFERPTDEALRAVARAQVEARTMGHPEVESAHLLLGLVQEADQAGIASGVLRDAGVMAEPVRRLVRESFSGRSASDAAGPPSFAASAREVFTASLRVAFAFEADEVGGEHLLVAIVRFRDQEAARILKALDVDLDLVRFTIKRRGMPRGEPGSIRLRSVSLSQSPWAPDAPIAPDSPERFTRAAEHPG